MRYRQTPHRLPVPDHHEPSLSPDAILSIQIGPGAFSLHGLKEVGGTGHILEVKQRLQGFYDFTHARSGFLVPPEAVSCQLRSLLGAFD